MTITTLGMIRLGVSIFFAILAGVKTYKKTSKATNNLTIEKTK